MVGETGHAEVVMDIRAAHVEPAPAARQGAGAVGRRARLAARAVLPHRVCSSRNWA